MSLRRRARIPPKSEVTNVYVKLLSAVLLAMAVRTFGQSSDRHGEFSGKLKLTPSGDGVHMVVLEPIAYLSRSHYYVSVPAGFSTDGASIPRALWSIVGSPFSGGNYIEAAVIHDRLCVTHEITWQETHETFYEAMLDSGVSEHYAKLLYYGVRIGGPRWKRVVTIRDTPEKKSTQHSGAPEAGAPDFKLKIKKLHSGKLTEADLKNFEVQLSKSETEGHPLSLQEIDKLAPVPSLDQAPQN